MVSGDEGAEEVMGTNPVWPTGPTATVTGPAVNLVVAPEAPEGSEVLLLADPADTDDEKSPPGRFPAHHAGLSMLQPALYPTVTNRHAKRYRILYRGP